MKSFWINANGTKQGFTIVEILVTLVMASLILGALFSFLIKQRRTVKFQRLKANVESVSQIAFFVMGRDIRRAGSNPKGWGAFVAGEPIALEQALSNRIVIRADLDGDGDVEDDSEEKVSYEFVDSPDDDDSVPDHIKRQAGDQLVIENVKNFRFDYFLSGSGWDPDGDLVSGQEPLVRIVKMTLLAGTGRVNPDTGQEDTKEIVMEIRPRNFDM